MSPPVYVAVLGDLHGHLTLAFRLVRRWELIHERSVSLILQVGDLGAFPPPFCLDRATMRFAEKDPDELGFRDYYEGSDEADEIFGIDPSPCYRIGANTVFVKGNHEDFAFLADMASAGDEPVGVDAYGALLYLPNGGIWSCSLGAHTLRIGSLGGVEPREGRTGGAGTPYFNRSELKALRQRVGDLDVLITHDVPQGGAIGLGSAFERRGSAGVRDIIRETQPRYHFCGHWHEPGFKLEVPGATQSYLLNEVNFRSARRLNRGCFGMLRWNGPGDSDFQIVDEPWLGEYTRSNFRTLGQDS